MTIKTNYDLIVVGGGMVGASLAIALKDSGLKIAMIEAIENDAPQQPSYDDRGIALAYGSQRIFESIGIWPQLAQYCTAIKHIHVSDRGHFGATRLSAEAEQVPALGQVITARAMGLVLKTALSKQNNLSLVCPDRVKALKQYDDFVDVELESNQTLTTKLVIAADGGQSTIRHLLDLTVMDHDYQQTAITTNITTERPHNGKAFERFTDTGPIALLPMSDNRSSLVWTVNTGDETALLNANDHDFLSQLQARFGYRLGHFLRVGQRHHYPLKLMQADQSVQQRVVLIGNAAHSLHPIAGQGFNLGLRDVAALADVLVDDNAFKDCGNARLLHDYQQWRQQDQNAVIKATSNLVNLFSNNNFLLGHCRGAALSVMDALPPVKHWLAQKSMGLDRKQPRLARGIPL